LTLLVTGGAGYIGSHTVRALQQAGFRLVVLDNLVHGHRRLVEEVPAGDLGEDHTPETHLIPLVLAAMAGLRSGVEVYGDDYPTPDGTCIRDYIHVCDLADAHVLGLKQILGSESSPSWLPRIYTLGNGSGYSVQQVIDQAVQIIPRHLEAAVSLRRPGDPPVLVASASKARQELGWTPRFPDLEQIITHAWQWHCLQWSIS
jgi:UDP-glucose 4-epimerase